MYLENNHCISNGYFNEDFCKRVIKIGEQLKIEEAKLGNNSDLKATTRQGKVSWINDITIMKEIATVINVHNKTAKWNFSLKSFEPLQYSVYEPGGHYDWHIDSHSKPYADGMIRKVSFTLCLNEEYEGGEFEVARPNPNPEKHKFTKFKEKFTMGTLISFPSFVWHKVHPVTSGTRKVLVGWSIGPSFV